MISQRIPALQRLSLPAQMGGDALHDMDRQLLIEVARHQRQHLPYRRDTAQVFIPLCPGTLIYGCQMARAESCQTSASDAAIAIALQVLQQNVEPVDAIGCFARMTKRVT